MKDLNILVICGGISDEREVSLRSGKNVHEALLRLGYAKAKLFDYKDIDSISELIQLKKQKAFDLAFLLTHGTYGEDGCIQGLLELLSVPYTGSDLTTSAICMNKTRAKEILSAHNLPVLKTYLATDVYEHDFKEHTEIIIKPICGGSSVGIEKFSDVEKFIDRVNSDTQLKSNLGDYFIEKFITGIELTTSIIEVKNLNNIDLENSIAKQVSADKYLVSLPLLELRPKKEFYDYEAKYTKGMTEFILPAQIEIKLAKKIHHYALAAYEVMGVRTCARVDFLIDKNTDEPYILEVNTLPGMTDTSDLPAQAKAAGINYDQVVELMLKSNVLTKHGAILSS